jgi:hypothetical protein
LSVGRIMILGLLVDDWYWKLRSRDEMEDCVVRLKTARMSWLKLQLTAVQNLVPVPVQGRVPAHSLSL